MDAAITGSELTRVMLEEGHQELWCALDEGCDQDAMAY